MHLQFLEFDLSEDTDGLCTWDALACPAARYNSALLAETSGLLRHLQHHLGPAGPLDQGHRWDMDLQVHDEAGDALSLETNAPACGRITLALSLCGGTELAEHLR